MIGQPSVGLWFADRPPAASSSLCYALYSSALGDMYLSVWCQDGFLFTRLA